RTIEVEDMLAEGTAYPLSHDIAQRFGHRTVVVVPLFREGQPFGTILLRRKEVRKFSDREVALLQTFGDQAAIALENVRLFNETSGTGLAITRRSVIHFPDIEEADSVPELAREGCRAMGINAVIYAPMLWENKGIGAIFVGRDHTGPFSDKEIALLKTFADQA